MRVLITGATGLMGKALIAALNADGHVVVRLVRRRKREASDILWDPAGGVFRVKQMEDFDAVVHLAGESIASRWTEKRKERILRSRVDGTRLLAESLARLKQ